MFYFGFNTGVVNAPETSIKVLLWPRNISFHLFFQLFIVESHKSHYGSVIDPNSIFTVITSAFIAGGMIGAMVGGLVADKMGRKRGLIISQVVGLLGGVVMAVSEPLTSWEVLLVGRLVAGLTAGLNTVI